MKTDPMGLSLRRPYKQNCRRSKLLCHLESCLIDFISQKKVFQWLSIYPIVTKEFWGIYWLLCLNRHQRMYEIFSELLKWIYLNNVKITLYIFINCVKVFFTLTYYQEENIPTGNSNITITIGKLGKLKIIRKQKHTIMAWRI